MGVVILKNGKELKFTKEIGRSEFNKIHPELGYRSDFSYFLEEVPGLSSKRVITVSDSDISIIKYNFK